MVVLDVRDVLRDICSAARVQFLLLPRDCSAPEAAALDFQFRAQIYESFDYIALADSVISLVPPEDAIDYKDDFGLHYLVFPAREDEGGGHYFVGPYLYHSCDEAHFRLLIQRHGLSENAIEAIHWYFKRVPVVGDVVGWRQIFSSFLSRYLGNPDLEIEQHPIC